MNILKKTKNVVSDFDDFGNKREQIEFTGDMEKKNNIVYHITCYPTNEELLFFKDYNVKYIWINTTINECKKIYIKEVARGIWRT